ncbi:N-acetylmuramoyl-L-alanine amidase [Candidatus Erwinia haradaeae]|uniref:N-acetylmuramoyl-L-alanine amidase n=1 Tax=Candidatus Erwinia haradaeae TaxID=1922217 RepID=UPI00138FB7C3|nr:N-acetylmuramoyl-L-alanine amidase [Candidatus Erwinia haradaeae]
MFSVKAANLLDINVSNSRNLAKITLIFSTKPVYISFPLHQPDRIVLDIHHSVMLRELSLNFHSKNIVKRIRTSIGKNKNSIRLVFYLTHGWKMKVSRTRTSTRYNILLTIFLHQRASTLPSYSKFLEKQAIRPLIESSLKRRLSKIHTKRIKKSSNISKFSHKNSKIIVAIDAGHGGQDPGAIGVRGLKEKNVTIAIARKLKKYLDSDPMFIGVMTRNADNFISVKARSEIAYAKKVHMLISIHADSAPNHKASGVSAWILSNRRANSEMAKWLEKHEKQSELLGKVNRNLLDHYQTDLYLNQALLDLQFYQSQRVSYDIATKVLAQLKRISILHKKKPEYASLGVLRSPCIPSFLIEVGFISNLKEEKLLGNCLYQQKITKLIYQGLQTYFLLNPLQSENKKT